MLTDEQTEGQTDEQTSSIHKPELLLQSGKSGQKQFKGYAKASLIKISPKHAPDFVLSLHHHKTESGDSVLRAGFNQTVPKSILWRWQMKASKAFYFKKAYLSMLRHTNIQLHCKTPPLITWLAIYTLPIACPSRNLTLPSCSPLYALRLLSRCRTMICRSWLLKNSPSLSTPR